MSPLSNIFVQHHSLTPKVEDTLLAELFTRKIYNLFELLCDGGARQLATIKALLH